MPKHILYTDGLYNSCDRVVISTVVKQVMNRLQINPNTKIIFNGDEGSTFQQGSNIDAPRTDETGQNLWGHDSKITIEVQSDYDRARILNMTVHRPETGFIFRDDSIGIYLKPIYSTETVNVTFTYKAVDKEDARRFRDRIQTSIANGRQSITHEASYHYVLPSSFLALISDIHKLREKNAPYGDTVDDYFTMHLTPRASLLTALDGKKRVWGISETQTWIEGHFQWGEIIDKPTKEDGGDSRDYTFEYKFNFDRPKELSLTYPIVIHNSIIPKIYRPAAQKDFTDERNKRMNLSTYLGMQFETTNRVLERMGLLGIKIPYYDDWVAPYIESNTLNIFTALVVITNEDKKFLLDLNDLGSIALDKDLLDFLKIYDYSVINNNNQSFFKISLYENNALLPSTAIRVDSSLKVYATADLNLRKTYHIRFSLMSDVMYLHKDVITRMQNSLYREKIAYYLNQYLACKVNTPIKKNMITYNRSMLYNNTAPVIHMPDQPIRSTMNVPVTSLVSANSKPINPIDINIFNLNNDDSNFLGGSHLFGKDGSSVTIPNGNESSANKNPTDQSDPTNKPFRNYDGIQTTNLKKAYISDKSQLNGEQSLILGEVPIKKYNTAATRWVQTFFVNVTKK